ncbi:MAG: hypothetical protein Q8P46_10855 [Hyphomicrobiales bacterium]|nr:hypothetical protein [Hyphomicrobiales bacterium]
MIKPQDVVEPQPLTCELLALEYADGGVALAEKVRLLVVAEPGLVDDILALIGCATPDQIAAIGAGLGQAAAILNETDPQAAEAIAVLVASLGNEAVQTAFVSGLGDATAAIGDEITGANPTALFVQSSGSSIGGGSAVSEN